MKFYISHKEEMGGIGNNTGKKNSIGGLIYFYIFFLIILVCCFITVVEFCDLNLFIFLGIFILIIFFKQII